MSDARASSKCFECSRDATVDHHVVPQSRGGVKTIPLCDDCHGLAHDSKMSHGVLTRDAMIRKKRLGQRVGTVPFGKRLKPDGVALEESDRERVVIGRILKMRREGASLRQIAAILSQDGVPTKNGGSHWSHTSVKSIICNQVESESSNG